MGKLWIADEAGHGKEFLLSDTIGFIRDLPHDLIDAFHSTLEDSLHSDLLLHIIDASDPYIEDKISVVERTLTHIQSDRPTWIILNKIDLLSSDDRSKLLTSLAHLDPIPVSAVSLEGLEELKSRIYHHFV